MAKGREITCVCYITLEDGRTIELSELTAAEREAWLSNVRRRLSINMSAYYSAHMDEYKRLEG